MPTPGKRWRHLTISTYNAWPPGDPRGWRSRHHKRHSSGDHRNPPPEGEHAGLLRHSRSISGQPTTVPVDFRGPIGLKFVEQFARLEHELLALSVSGLHAHGLIELPAGLHDARHEVGRAKQAVTLAFGRQITGKKLWQKDCGVKPITDAAHHRNTYAYIRRHVSEGAWVWTYREGVVDRAAVEAEEQERRGRD